MIREYCERHEIPANVLYVDNLHFSPLGHRVVADAIEAFVDELQWIQVVP